jgi:hypothetical protein
VSVKAIPKAVAPELSIKDRERLAVIWRRLQFLERRASEHRGNPSHDIAEAAALRWLIGEAAMPVPPQETKP